MLNMPSRSSVAKHEPNQTGTPSPLLGAMDSAVGASQVNSVANLVIGSHVNTHATASVAEGACRQEKYSLQDRIFTARDS